MSLSLAMGSFCSYHLQMYVLKSLWLTTTLTHYLNKMITNIYDITVQHKSARNWNLIHKPSTVGVKATVQIRSEQWHSTGTEIPPGPCTSAVMDPGPASETSSWIRFVSPTRNCRWLLESRTDPHPPTQWTLRAQTTVGLHGLPVERKR